MYSNNKAGFGLATEPGGSQRVFIRYAGIQCELNSPGDAHCGEYARMRTDAVDG
jgi:hypothetical protein